MAPLVTHIIDSCWAIFLVVWLLAALFTKRTVYRESATHRLLYLIPIILGWYLIFRGHHFPCPLNLQFIPRTDPLLLAAAILCVAGLGFCLWARTVLGRNWSGTVTLKEDHQLIVRGPYRLVRHPIYTGLLAMLVATAIAQARISAVLGVLLVFVSFWIKLREEEEVMLRQFPDQYAAYQRRVKRIIPFVL